MPFGLGFGELIVALLMLAAPVVLLVLAVRFIAGMSGTARSGHDEIEHHQLATELQQAQTRIEELEARVARVDEKASFTQDLLEKPRTGQ